MFKRLIPFISAAGVAAVGMFVVFTIRSHAQASAVQYPAEYNVTLDRIVTGSDGQVVVHMRILKSRRSDGATVSANVVTNKDGSETMTRFITFPDRQLNLTLSDRVKLKSTFGMTEMQVQNAMKTYKDPACADAAADNAWGGSTFVGWSIVAGFKAAEYAVEDGAIRDATFLAPDLNCLAIKIVTQSKNRQGKFTGGTTIDQATVVEFASAPDSLFAVPEDYQEVAPSVIRDAIYAAKGQMHGRNYDKKNENMDRNYFKHRPAGQ